MRSHVFFRSPVFSRKGDAARVADATLLDQPEGDLSLNSASSRTQAPTPTRCPYLIWLGAVVEDELALVQPGVSLAANRWQRGLVTALAETGHDLALRGYLIDPSWPRGIFRQQERPSELRIPGLDAKLVGYPNLTGVRSLALQRRLAREVEVLIARRGRPRALLSYNLPFQYAATAWSVWRAHRVPWIPIVADWAEAPHKRLVLALRLTRAQGRVYLSWGRYRDDPFEPKLHLDGGVHAPRRVDRALQRAFLYSGVMDHYGGVALLAAAFQRLEARDVVLWLCGKGRNELVERLAHKDDRIKIWGPVSDEKLGELSRSCLAFVNPRPDALEASRHTFPSKVLEYLSYGKPVISSWTDGLAPDYRTHLILAEPCDEPNLARCMQQVLSLAPPQWEARQTACRAFLEREKLWSIQAQRLVAWLDEAGL
jgi:glycosyltransferase involved in cell wall biosynthesis